MLKKFFSYIKNIYNHKIINFICSVEKFYSQIPVIAKKFLFVILIIIVIFKVLDFVFPLKINISYSPIILDKNGEIINAFLSIDDKWRMYTEINEISTKLKKTIIFKEDKYFYYHPGINPISIIRALINNIHYGRRTSGASTITMQVARLLEPKDRTYINKIIEMLRALQLEWHYSKNEILQLYLNLVPYGSNIEGIKAASLIYFNKMPDHLSLSEITCLTIIPNNPNLFKPDNNKDTIILNERNKWLKKFQKAKIFNEQEITDALQESIKYVKYDIPKYSPHLSYRLKKQYSNQKIIHTTIDLETQLKLETIVKNYINKLYYRKIKNCAVMVIDNKTANVISYIGSADFHNQEDGGQVDGITAIRSPGSTLKPLVYGMAFDCGLLTPKTVIYDIPENFNGYEPENYDGKFRGMVTVEEALINSLNVPAVKIEKQLGLDNIIEKLKIAGFKKINNDKNKLGLSLILGGCGVSLEELTHLYFIFANQGVIKNFNYTISTQNKNNNNKIKLLSPEATFMVTNILAKLTRPDFPTDWQNSPNLPHIAWKTGTSYGRKDAWSIGYNKKYTVGVWVGNFSGKGVPELSGASTATPLLFQIFNVLDKNPNNEWFEEPEKLQSRIVCSVTGLLPSSFCKDLTIDYYIPGVSSLKKCDHLKEIFVSPDSSISYCTCCCPATGYIKAYYQNYPAELIGYFETNHINYKKIPPHNPLCERMFTDGAPIITSPINNTEYLVDIKDSMYIALCCITKSDVKKVYWYINKKYYKDSEPFKKIFFYPTPGTLEIICVDDKGRKSKSIITVKKICF